MRQFGSFGVQTGLCLWALGAVVTVAIAPHQSAIAGAPGCKAIAGGTLDVELPAGQRSTRMVQLSAGEIINFECGGDAKGATVTLVSGQGAPRTILSANGPAKASFTAPDTTAYVFAIEAAGKAASSVKADCAKSASAKALDETDGAVAEFEVAQLEGDANGLSRRSAISVGLSEFAASARAGDSPIGQWSLYSPGSGAQAVDTALAAEDEAAELSLRLSANSEINPNDLGDVLKRIERVSKLDGTADKDTQSVLTFAAISVPGLMPKEGNYRDQDAPVNNAQAQAVDAAAVQRAAEHQQDATDVNGWWVTHLKEEPGGLGDSTQTAVVRRDTPVVAASSAFPPPPMALGAFVPPADVISPPGGSASH